MRNNAKKEKLYAVVWDALDFPWRNAWLRQEKI